MHRELGTSPWAHWGTTNPIQERLKPLTHWHENIFTSFRILKEAILWSHQYCSPSMNEISDWGRRMVLWLELLSHLPLGARNTIRRVSKVGLHQCITLPATPLWSDAKRIRFFGKSVHSLFLCSLQEAHIRSCSSPNTRLRSAWGGIFTPRAHSDITGFPLYKLLRKLELNALDICRAGAPNFLS